MIHKIKGMLWVVLFFVACLLMLPMTAFADTPISRNTDEVSKGRYKVYVNPVNYEVSKGKFAKIDPASTTSTATTLSRNKGVVKALFRDRQVTFSPDEGQWSLVVRAGTQTLTGGPIGMSLASKPVVDPTYPDRTQMDGNKFEVSTTSKGSKFLIPSTSSVTDFSCQFIMTPSAGLEVVQKDGQVWFEYKGKWVLGIGEPQLLNTKTLEPLDGETLPPKDLVDFTLVDNGNGTWTYTKIPGPDFSKLKKPATYYIDADIVYGEQSGGSIYAGNAAWATKHDQVNGDSVDNIENVFFGAEGGATKSYFRRLFLQIDLSAFEAGGTVDSASITMLTYFDQADVSIQVAKSTATMAFPISNTQYQKYGAAISNIRTATSGWVTWTLSDMDYVQDSFGGMFKYCFMDSRDLADTPAVFDGFIEAYPWFAGRIPYITLTGYAPTPATTASSPWGGFLSWKDNDFSIWP